jgi:hypothetical protein
MDYRLVASRVFANAQTCLPGVAPPNPAPAAVLPMVGRPRDAGLAVRATAWTCYGHDGWRHRPSPVGLVSRSTRDAHPCRVHSRWVVLHTPPLALSGWGKGKEEALWPVPKETPLLFGH